MRIRPIMARFGLAVLTPLLLVTLLEGALRLLEIGYPTSFLRPATVQGQPVSYTHLTLPTSDLV